MDFTISILKTNKFLMLSALITLNVMACSSASAEDDAQASLQQQAPRDGQIRRVENDHLQAWDDVEKQWVSIELFWRRYAGRRGGLTWGSRTEYPRYSKVKELDTMIINLPSGPCMMEFSHNRWRRANNVRRWSKEFDEYGGCPHVFD